MPGELPGPPSYSFVRAPGSQPERLVLILHGILGQGSNWRGFARRLTRQLPDWEAVLVDLRAHGDSRSLPPPDGLDAAARDLSRLRASLPRPVAAVLGHSFGGKVALRFVELEAAEAPDASMSRLFVVDSLPGARPDRRGSEGTVAVVDMLDALPATFEDRGGFVRHVTERGFSEPLAKWLAQSLDRQDDGRYRFGLDMARIRALLDDYFSTDLWPTLDPPPAGTAAHLIIGGRSTVFAPDDLERAEALQAAHPGRVHTHVLSEADHWVHVDDPDGLHEIVAGALAQDGASKEGT